jgi:hypothetical protein
MPTPPVRPRSFTNVSSEQERPPPKDDREKCYEAANTPAEAGC